MYQVTLITGDVVWVAVDRSGEAHVSVTAAEREDGSVPPVTVVQGEMGIDVVPADAVPAIAEGVLDPDLFDVEVLISSGYVDGAGGLPVIVQYRENAATSRRALTAQAGTLPGTDGSILPLQSIDGAAVTVQPEDGQAFWESVRGIHGPDADGELQAAQALDPVKRIWLDQRVEVDLAESVPLVGAPQAWQGGWDGAGVRVAVLDTGVDAAHPDLVGQVVASASFVDGAPVQDGHGHGTHVASTVAGTGAQDARGRGVAPGADLVIGKVLGDGGSGSISGMIAGMEWAARDQDADIVNMSLGCSGCQRDGSSPQDLAVDALTEETGALFVVAAGNGGPNGQSVDSPGSASSALTVAATDKQDGLAAFSSRGPRLGNDALKPEIAAPGAGIVAARASGTAMGVPVDAHYTAASGTSMAAPHVAGAAAVLAQQRPELGPAELKAILATTAVDAGHGVYQQGGGRLDVARATSQDLVSRTAVLDFGRVGAPTTQQIVLANQGTEAVTVDLDAALEGPRGPAPEGTLTIEPTSITIAPGATGSATATFIKPSAEGGYSGRVTAAGGGDTVGIAVGAISVADAAVTVLARGTADGGTQQCASVVLFGLDTFTSGTYRSEDLCGDGSDLHTSVRLPAGTYWALAHAGWTEDGTSRSALLMEQEVEVVDGSEVVLDADSAVDVDVSTPRPAQSMAETQVLEREAATDGNLIQVQIRQHQSRSLVTPSERAATGSFRFVPGWVLAATTPAGVPLGERDYHYILHPTFDVLPAEYAVGSEQLATVNARLYSHPSHDQNHAAVAIAPLTGVRAEVNLDGLPTGRETTWFTGPVDQARPMGLLFDAVERPGPQTVDRGVYQFDQARTFDVRFGEWPRTPGPVVPEAADYEADPTFEAADFSLRPCNGCREANIFSGHVGFVTPDGRNNTGAAGLKVGGEPRSDVTEGIRLYGPTGQEIEPFIHSLCHSKVHTCVISSGSEGEDQ